MVGMVYTAIMYGHNSLTQFSANCMYCGSNAFVVLARVNVWLFICCEHALFCVDILRSVYKLSILFFIHSYKAGQKNESPLGTASRQKRNALQISFYAQNSTRT